MPAGRSAMLIVGIIAIAFIITAMVYPRLPDRVASHWNAQGRADGWIGKGWGVFLVPITMLGLAVLFMLLPLIDPLGRNVASFRPYYDTFIVIFLAFLLAIQAHILLWNMGTRISPTRFLPIPVGILIYSSGVLIQHAKRNWFVGVRTPWTLSSDRVWDQTHRVTGALFKVCGALTVLGLVYEEYWLWLFAVPLVATTIFSVAYSYVLHRDLQKGAS